MINVHVQQPFVFSRRSTAGTAGLPPPAGTKQVRINACLSPVVRTNDERLDFRKGGNPKVNKPIGSMYGIFTYIWLIFMGSIGR